MALRTENLVKTYGRRKVVDNVSLSISPGEIVGLLGPNGAGKTTTFYSVIGLIKPDSGYIYLNDQEITAYPIWQRARAGIGYLAQEPSIFRGLTVQQNILSILETMPWTRAKRNERLDQLLGDLNIGHIANQKAYTLSGGEKRRVEIARALVMSPRFILLDEPFVGIDPIAVNELQKIVQQLKAFGLGVLITDQNVRDTLKVIDRAYIIHLGRVLIEGSAEYLLSSPEAREVYLGTDFTM
jgi:lipopolysaccharide export system ATP-binding protein